VGQAGASGGRHTSYGEVAAVALSLRAEKDLSGVLSAGTRVVCGLYSSTLVSPPSRRPSIIAQVAPERIVKTSTSLTTPEVGMAAQCAMSAAKLREREEELRRGLVEAREAVTTYRAIKESRDEAKGRQVGSGSGSR